MFTTMKQTTKKQSTTTFVIIILSLIIGGGLILWSYSVAGKSGSAPKEEIASDQGPLAGTESAYDFGEVSMATGLVNHEFVLRNNSSAPVKIGRAETSCMCTTVYLKTGGKEVGPFGMAGHSGIGNNANLTISPSEELIVRTVFDPAAHGPAGVGQVERQVILEVGDTPLMLSFSAVVTP